MRIRKVIVIVACVLCVLTCVTAFAESSSEQDQVYTALIMDEADILTDQAAIMEMMEYVSQYSNVMLYTTDDNPKSVEYLGDKLAQEYFGLAPSVIFIIDMDNREICITAANDAQSAISTSVANTITDNVYSYASDEDYDQCAITAFKQIHAKFRNENIPEPMRYIGNAFLAIMIGVGAASVLARMMSRIRFKKDEGITVDTECQAPMSTIISVTKSSRSSGGSGGSGGGRSSGGFSSSSGSHKF